MRPQKLMAKQIAVLAKRTESKIVFIRGVRVILDTDLAELYGVTAKRLNEQVKRNARRFPDDFVFQLSAEELANLRSQIVTSSAGHGGRRYLPYAFSEHGAIMAASILNSERADEMSLFVVRAFIRMREALAANQQIIAKLSEIERRVEGHDSDIQDLIEAIRELMEPPPANNRRIGFSLASSSAKESSKRR
jgi:ORF6N domain